MPDKNHTKKTMLPAAPLETQAAEALTIGWMVAVMTAVVCELGVIAAKLASAHWPAIKQIGVAGELLMFAAGAVGLVVVVLIPLVYKARVAPPPRAVTVFAAIIGVGPWLVIVAQLIYGAFGR